MRLLCVDSTNNYLKSQLSNSAPLQEGTVILAEEQNAGRGQQNNVWYSHPGKNLTFSILLKPSFLSVQEQFSLNKAISIAINEVLETIIGSPAKIKWPNDMYVGDEKIGGILIENIIQGNRWKYAIIGIGLNVNQEEFPPEAAHATSLAKILHSHYDLQSLLAELCNSIESWYLKLRAGKIKEIEQTYINRLYRYKSLAHYRAEGKKFEAKIVDVDKRGLLQLDTGAIVKSFNIKEVEFLK